MAKVPWLRVYLSGPISKGDQEHNFAQAATMQVELVKLRFAVLNPMLTMKLPGHEAIAHESWIASDLPWVEMADAVLRLPGESIGADMETRHADEHGVPVFHSLADLLAWRVALTQRGSIARRASDGDIRVYPIG